MEEPVLEFILFPDFDGRNRLSPGSCGAAPPPPVPAKPSVSPSSEAGERNADEAFCGSSSAATTRGGSAREERVTWGGQL
jgi:hypothetical protein